MISRSAIHQLEKRDRRGRGFIAILMLVAISVLASSWVGLFSFMTASAAHGSFIEVEEKYVPDVESETLNFPDLSRVSRVYASNGTLLAELHDGRVSEPVRFDDVPDEVIYAVLAAEDEDFFEHEGVDFQAIISAARDNLLSDSTRGGSTITQQIVKKNFVGDEQTIKRKIREAVTAIELERRYSKEQILEFYLNSVYFGASAYGVTAAAHEFYQKDLEELSIAEAATLAVLPRNPTEFNPRKNAEAVLERRDEVIREMYENGFITEAARDVAWDQPLNISDPVTFVSPADHVVAEVKRQLLSEPEFDFLGETREERKVAIFGCPADDVDCAGGGGLDIVLTIDLELQDTANNMLQSWLPVPSDPEVSAPTGAIAMVENWTGAVRVMASGLPFEQEQFDLAVQGRRNPGSSFKPFALVAGLESGKSLNSFFDASSPKDVQCPYVCSSLGNIWRVSNAGGGRSGLMRLFDATYNSVNTVYAQLSVEVGPENIADVAHRMGIQSDLEEVPSLALGAGAVSPLEMASAYTNFATNGQWSKPYIVESIADRAGNSIYDHQPNPIQTIEPALAAAARQPLELVPTGAGTARRANLGGRPQGGKTGTHQNFMEAWFVGFVSQYSTAVWIGFPEEQIPLTNVTINGQNFSRVFGGTGPAPLWKSFMDIALTGVPVEDFPPDPAGVSSFFFTPTTTVPSVVGGNESQATRALLNAHLNAAVVEVPSIEPEGTVVAQSPEGGAVISEGSAVTIEVSTGIIEVPLPDLIGLAQGQVGAALANWQEANGVTITFSFEFLVRQKVEKQGIVLQTTPRPGAMIEDGGHLVVTVGVPPPDDG